MMSSSLSSWQSTNNYRREGDVVYGVYQGCGFSVSEEDGGKLFVFMLSAGDNRAFDSFENALVDEGGELSQGQVGDVENYLAIFYDESADSVSLRTMDKVLDFVIAEARQCGFRVPNVCVRCAPSMMEYITSALPCGFGACDDMTWPSLRRPGDIKFTLFQSSADEPLPLPSPWLRETERMRTITTAGMRP